MSTFLNRYERNKIFTPVQQANLAEKTVGIIGCGGLGGYAAEILARLGIGSLVVCDGDLFEESNLNRQLLSTEKNLGKAKALAAAERIGEVNSNVTVTVFSEFLTAANSDKILEGCDLVIDALDSAGLKLMLQEECKKLGIPMVHGAIGGWFGQVTTIFPGDDTLTKLYKEEPSSEAGNPSFTPAAVAGVQVSEAVKVLLGEGEVLRGLIWFMDLLHGEAEVVEI